MKLNNSKPSVPILDEYIKSLDSMWSSRLLSNNGVFNRKLVEYLTNFLSSDNVFTVTSCDIGLIVSMAALNLPTKSEVILPSFTFNSTVNALLWNDLVPIFADIDPETLCIDYLDIQRKLTSKTAAIIAVNVFGNVCNYQKISMIAKKQGLKFVTDSAGALGSKYQNRMVGTLADIEVFSLSSTKIVTSAEGGVISSKKKYVSRIKSIKNYGFIRDYNSVTKGINGKMSEIHAALGYLNIQKIDGQLKNRNRIAKLYINQLKGVGDIKFQKIEPNSVSTYSNFCIFTKKRRLLSKYLEKNDVVTRIYFKPLHLTDFFKVENHSVSLPGTLKAWNEIICLPIFNDMADEEIVHVCTLIKKFYSHGN